MSKIVKTKPKKVVPIKSRKGPVSFLKEVNAELKKVTWPDRQELISSTIIVIVAVLIISVYIGVVDIIFSKMISLLEL